MSCERFDATIMEIKLPMLLGGTTALRAWFEPRWVSKYGASGHLPCTQRSSEAVAFDDLDTGREPRDGVHNCARLRRNGVHFYDFALRIQF